MNDIVIARFDMVAPDIWVETTPEAVAPIDVDDLADQVAFYAESGCTLRAGVDWMEVVA